MLIGTGLTAPTWAAATQADTGIVITELIRACLFQAAERLSAVHPSAPRPAV